MIVPGSVAIWFGFALALLGIGGIALSGVGLLLSSLEGGATATVGAALLLAGLVLIAGGVWWEARRRDRIEAGLRRSEKLLRAAVSTLEQKVAVLDLTGRVLASTRVVGAADAVGATAGGVASGAAGGVVTAYVPDLAVLRDDPTPQARAAWEGIQAVLEGRQREFQLEYPVQDGAGTRWYLLRARLLEEEGEAARVAVVQEEITARVEAQRALREGESRLRSLLTSVDDLVFALNRDQSFICAYGHWLVRAGLEGTALCTRRPAEIFGEDASRSLIAVAGRVLQGEHLLHDWVLSGEAGVKRLQTSLSPLREADGTITGIVGVGRDVTARVREEEELRRRDAILETIGFASSHFLRSTDWESSIRDVLEHLARATNTVRVDLRERLNDAEGRPVLRLIQQWSIPELEERSARSLHGDAMLDHPSLRPWIEALSAGRPVLIQAGELPERERLSLQAVGIDTMVLLPILLGKQWAGVLSFDAAEQRVWSATEVEALSIAADVFAAALDRIRIEEALRESEAQLQQAQKMEAVGRLAGGVAHDFNNLLTAIKGRTELLLSEGQAVEQFESDLTEIRAAAIRAATLTRQLLAFSRRQVLEPKVLDLNQIVREIELMLRRLIGEDVILVTRLAPDLGSVQADPGHVEQVLMNLLVNARDAMPDGGAVTIETANLELDRRAARLEGVNQPGSYVLLQVSDTGCGIPAELHERIFEPFFTTKEQGKGTGLGLSMIWGIIKQSGGHIAVRSVLGKGSQFRILLPRGMVRAQALEPVTVAPDPALGSETILLVEDEAAVRSLVRKVLERRGYTVLEATNGAEAIQLAESFPGRIDLILTDVVMPDITGPILVETLAPRLPLARVLFMSGYTDQEIIRHGVDAFHAGFIGKPFAPDELAAKVRVVLDADLSYQVD